MTPPNPPLDAANASEDAGMPHIQPEDSGLPMPMDAEVEAGFAPDSDGSTAWVPPEPRCVDGVWQLAPGFLLARKVDYVADRDQKFDSDGGGLVGLQTYSSAGVPCASATNMASCMSALQEPTTGLGRHLVTTAGDNVRLWPLPSVRTLFGLIDTSAEAVFWASTNSIFQVPCAARITPRDGYFELKGLFYQGGCANTSPPTTFTATVGSDGTVQQITSMPLDGGCPVDASTDAAAP
jgi:hypothetical protein